MLHGQNRCLCVLCQPGGTPRASPWTRTALEIPGIERILVLHPGTDPETNSEIQDLAERVHAVPLRKTGSLQEFLRSRSAS